MNEDSQGSNIVEYEYGNRWKASVCAGIDRKEAEKKQVELKRSTVAGIDGITAEIKHGYEVIEWAFLIK